MDKNRYMCVIRHLIYSQAHKGALLETSAFYHKNRKIASNTKHLSHAGKIALGFYYAETS